MAANPAARNGRAGGTLQVSYRDPGRNQPSSGRPQRAVQRSEISEKAENEQPPREPFAPGTIKRGKVQKEDDPLLYPLQSFRSKPPPPSALWDIDDVQYLDKVRCHAWIRMTHVDPKNGRYEGRIKCHWAFRTLNSQEHTEPRTRVPGLRLPRIVSNVEESRIWRHFDGDSERTLMWRGATVLSFYGFEMFEVNDFPFDRQVINLDLVEFVWRSEKGSDDYFEAMKVVSFTTETISMLPEWDTFPAIIEARNVKKPGTGPSFGTRFIVKLRLQRKEKYYITQIFMVTFLILSASLLPLALEPGDTFIGDRLSLHASGLLTLVAFKYGVSHELPSVPYETFVSTFLTAQIVTLVFVSSESVMAYKFVGRLITTHTLNIVEDLLLYVLLLLWLVYFLHVAFVKGRVPWQVVLQDQGENKELKDEGPLFLAGSDVATGPEETKEYVNETWGKNDSRLRLPVDGRAPVESMLTNDASSPCESGYTQSPDRPRRDEVIPPRSQPQKMSSPRQEATIAISKRGPFQL